MSANQLTAARREAELARERLGRTLDQLRYRLKPATLASGAWDGVKEKSADLAEDAVQAVKGRPKAVSLALAAFTLFLAREPIKSAAGRFFWDDEDEKPQAAPVSRGRKPRARKTKSEGAPK
jgi:hypothetical protein